MACPSPSLLSPLYSRFNGFCLGAFMGGAQQPLGASRYRVIRRRIHEFLEEIGVAARLPALHEHFVAAYSPSMLALLAELRRRDAQLHACCGLGAMAALFAGGYTGTTPAIRRGLKARWQPELQRLGLGPQAFDGFARNLARAARTRDATALVTQVYLLLADVLQPLPAEVDTCFVAMPFKQPYAGHFSRWYRPALQRAGFRAIRAWGGLTDEEYYPFIAPLIARCAGVLADLSAHNLNVANEVGLAHGANCPTFLVMGEDDGPPPSNLADLLVLRYDRHAPGWPQHDVARLSRFVRLHWRAYVASLTHEDLIHATAHRLLQMLLAAGKPVPDAILALASVQRPADTDPPEGAAS